MGASATRRSLDELRQLGVQAPAMHDVIVEGREDARLLNWCFTEWGFRDARAFAVDDRVEIPAEHVLELPHEVNARGRVLALAKAASEWEPRKGNLTCVIDADFDILNPHPLSFDTLLRTDYASMEVYSLQLRPFGKFLQLNGDHEQHEPKSVVSHLRPIWVDLFILRYLLHTESPPGSMIAKFPKHCIASRGSASMDLPELLRKCTPLSSDDARTALLDQHRIHLAGIPGGNLYGIRGHDIAPILLRFLKLSPNLRNAEELESRLRQCLELVDLESQQLFISLQLRIAGP